MNTVILHSCVDASLLQRTYEASWKSSEWTFEFPRNSSYDKRHPKITLIEHGQVISKDENIISLIKEIHSQIYDSYECFDREILFAGISMKDITFKENVHTDHNGGCKLLGLLNPIWKKEWGGGFIHDEKVYDMQPGNFVLFDSTVEHAADKILCEEKRVAIDFYQEKLGEARLDFYK